MISFTGPLRYLFLVFRYTIEISHGRFTWTVKRRHRHLLKLHTELFLMKASSQLPVTAQPKIKTKMPKFPKRPEVSVIGQRRLQKRKRQFEKYLQGVVDHEEFRNHKETLLFLEVSSLSFVEDLGLKSK